MSSDIILRLEKGTDLSYSEGDDNFAHIRRLYRFTEDSVTSGGTGNNFTIASVAETQTSFVANMMFGFIANHTNTGSAPTLVIDGLAAKTINRANGDPVGTGEIEQNRFYIVRYDTLTDTYTLLESPQIKPLAEAIDTINSTITDVEDEVSDIRSTQGVSSGSTNLGSFSGNTIPNGSTVKSALQSLETGLEDAEDAITTNANAIANIAASGSLGSTGSLVIPITSNNAIVINWGSISAPTNAIVTATYDQPLTTVYQGVVTNRTTASSNDAVNCVPGLNSVNIRNNAGSTTAMYIVIGRLAI